MVTVSGADFALIINASDLTATKAENLLSLTVGALKLLGADIPNLTGTVGAKSMSVEDIVQAAVYLAARNVYASLEKNADNSNSGIQSLTLTHTDLMSNPAVWQMLKDIAGRLQENNWSRAII